MLDGKSFADCSLQIQKRTENNQEQSVRIESAYDIDPIIQLSRKGYHGTSQTKNFEIAPRQTAYTLQDQRTVDRKMPELRRNEGPPQRMQDLWLLQWTCDSHKDRHNVIRIHDQHRHRSVVVYRHNSAPEVITSVMISGVSFLKKPELGVES